MDVGQKLGYEVESVLFGHGASINQENKPQSILANSLDAKGSV